MTSELDHVRVEQRRQFFERRPRVATDELIRIHVTLSIQKICIDERREQHANPERETVFSPRDGT